MIDLGERVRRARLQLMLRHPFLAGATARLPLVEVETGGWCATAATDGYRIYWTSGFFARLSDEEIAGVLAHEMLHAVLGHCERRGTREATRWNIAIDHATNLLVLKWMRLRLPRPYLADPDFADKTAEEIYDALRAPAATAAASGRGRKPAPRPSIGIARRRAAQESTEDAAPRTHPGSRDADRFDIHLAPDDPRCAESASPDDPSPLEMARLRHDLQRELRDGMSGTFGRVPGDVDAAILRARRAHTPWQALLARCFTGIRRDDYRLIPPARKHVWRGLMLPSMGVPGPSNIVCAIDTSGSVDERLAARFLAEVHALRCTAKCRLHVLQCDTAITDHRVYEAWEQPPATFAPETFRGRGGTDFRPVFDLAAGALARHEGRPDLLAYLTDGEGSFPARAPDFPVVWLLPEGARARPPFGARIEIPAA